MGWLHSLSASVRALGDRWARLSEFAQVFVVLVAVGAISLLLTLAFDTSKDTAVAVGLGIVGVLALVYANHQFRDAKDTISQLTFIRSQLTTERLADIAHFVSQVVTILDKADEQVAIFCDYPTFGSWLNPRGYRFYMDAIARTQATMRLVCLNEWRRTQLARERLATPAFDALRRDPRTREFLAAYAAAVGDPRPVPALDSMTPEEFVEILEDSNKAALRTQFVRGDARQAWETDLFMPLFFWIIDEAEAVFALAPRGELLEQPLAFRTRDTALVDSLSTVLEGYIRVRSSTEKHDENRTGLIGFAGSVDEWRALLRGPRDASEEAVRLRAEIEAWVRPRALG